ncbi:MAG: hypothetical protein ACRC6K_04330 [Fusobacteriaceae bacterium]
MKFIKKIILITVLLWSPLNTYGIKISPISFDKRIDVEDSFAELIFENESSDPIRYKISVHPPDKGTKDMSKWIKLSPKILTIPAYGKRPLKIFAKSPEGTPAGEYSFNLKVDTVLIPTISKNEENKIKGNATIAFTPIIEMSGYVGEANFKEKINIENLKLDKAKGTLKGKLVNQSYIGKELGISYIGNNGAVVGGERLGRVPANFSKEITLTPSPSVLNSLTKIRIYDIKEKEEIKIIELF